MSKPFPLPPLYELNRLFYYHEDTGRLIRKVAGKGGNAPKGSVVGYPNSKGYLVVKITNSEGSKGYFVHRLIWFMVTGEDPGELDIDHEDLNTANNKFDNLRVATRSVNKFNSVKRTTTLYPGVNCKNGRYNVRICVDYKRVQIGTYGTLSEAIAARKEAERELAILRNDSVLLERSK